MSRKLQSIVLLVVLFALAAPWPQSPQAAPAPAGGR